ncbi:MAG: pilus assembly protein TadG-related protein [Chloroflexota bacterium]|nr:pilus assembly protein TadG-related protein [Chloroflexota bacterium]
MKTIINDHKLERGQIIPIVVVALIALIALAALILDGGALMSNRRAAQNAADAAALAGARVLCRQYNATDDDIEDAIDLYIDANHATLIEWKLTDENVGVIEGLFKGEVVVTAEVEHGSFFAKIFGEDMLTATATAGAGCFPYGASVVLPIAFPCYQPVMEEDPGVYVVGEDCDYAALNWEYFASIATGCGMGDNPLLGNVDPTEEQATCIRDYLDENHSDLIYVIVNEERYCAKDPDNPDPITELICEITAGLEGHYQLNTSAHGWLNLGGQPSVNDMTDWISGTDNPAVRVHSWLSFIPGVSAQPVFTALEERLFDIVWIPVINEACDHEPIPGDECYARAHTPPFGPYPDDECPVNSDLPGQDFGHVVAFAPFFTTCVRNGSNDLKDYLKDYGYDSEIVFESECPGFGLAVNANDKANMEALSDTNYSFEGYFIDPWYLEDPENLSIVGADLGIYTVSLTR